MSQRLFFALWPDDGVRHIIATITKQVVAQHYGKPVCVENLHLTLAFLGNVNQTQRDCVEAVAESISITPFSLCLDHLGVFPKPKVLWMGLQEQPDALMQLSEDLCRGAEGCGIALDKKTFNPHVTLMRKVKNLHALEIESVQWQVRDFCLVQSVSYPEGVEYRVIKRW